MAKGVPKVLSLQDMSCAGRCSLTAVLPVMAACGVEAVPLPTAVFSNHLAFPFEEHVDFTPYMEGFMDAWDRNGLTFDAVYSGFLASPEQIHLVEEAIRRYGRAGGLVMIDPAMADNGRLYSLYTPAMVEAMGRLMGRAAVVKPNYTEACLLAGKPYKPETVPGDEELMDLVEGLPAGPEWIIMTSVPAGRELRNLVYHRKTGRMGEVLFPRLPLRTFGTGDMFCAVVTALFVKGVPMEKAARKATEFLTESIEDTIASGAKSVEGIIFENRLLELAAFAACEGEKE